MQYISIAALLLAAIAATFAFLAWRASSALSTMQLAATLTQELSRLLEAQREALNRTLREELTQSRMETERQTTLLRGELSTAHDTLRQNQSREAQASREEAQKRFSDFQAELFQKLTALGREQQQALAAFNQRLEEAVAALRRDTGETREQARLEGQQLREAIVARLEELAKAHQQEGEKLRAQVQERLETLQRGNEARLEKMQQIVDEKLQQTLETRLGESFRQVSERLEQVHRGLGEMQTLAAGVGDLKRTLSNVKSRGTWGEYQLGNLLEQVLAPGQYETNVKVNPESADLVEFAVRLPGADDHPVWLPVDAKFPMEDFLRLQDAADRADVAAVEVARIALRNRILLSAREVSSKYVCPPHTTPFAIIYLPTEGLYAEVARYPDLIDTLQRESKVTVAGPSTMLAHLTALQMGFKTLAIQKRSEEVWRILGAVRTEFGKFGKALSDVRKKLSEAQNKIDDTERRTRVMGNKLKGVDELPENEVAVLLGREEDVEEEESAI